MAPDLDPILSVPARLAIVSVLIKVKQAEFTYLMEITQTTQGNLSHQLKRLQKEGYIDIEKLTTSSYPQTICRITKKGRKAFENYVAAMKKYLHL